MMIWFHVIAWLIVIAIGVIFIDREGIKADRDRKQRMVEWLAVQLEEYADKSRTNFNADDWMRAAKRERDL